MCSGRLAKYFIIFRGPIFTILVLFISILFGICFLRRDNALTNLRFGVELEVVFAFHQNHFREWHGPGVRYPVVVKPAELKGLGLPESDGGVGARKMVYDSWHLQDEEASQDGARIIRQYSDEPLLIARNILDPNGTKDITLIPHYQSLEEAEYKRWYITADPTLRGDRKRMNMELQDRITNKNNWDSYGLEFISPVFETWNPAIWYPELEYITSKIQGSPSASHGAFVNRHCGLHVHIGPPQREIFSTETIRHLGFILYVYEPVINTLHPPLRWTTAFIEVSTENPGVPVSNRWAANVSPDGFWSHTEGLNRSSLIDHICPHGKKHLVNLSPLKRAAPFSTTIEFRHHAGTVDMKDIRWWVLFTSKFVALAQRCAATGHRIPVPTLEPSLDDLMHELNFPKDGIEFYQARAADYGALKIPDVKMDTDPVLGFMNPY
ncbi:putative amidoligase enzyme-domain-containing protein [Mariannaea sp. PMI_226]|nr:putative amidoligase enzyme-domain-containing protein [Mariannaea sp. PMI_226]